MTPSESIASYNIAYTGSMDFFALVLSATLKVVPMNGGEYEYWSVSVRVELK